MGQTELEIRVLFLIKQEMPRCATPIIFQLESLEIARGNEIASLDKCKTCTEVALVLSRIKSIMNRLESRAEKVSINITKDAQKE